MLRKLLLLVLVAVSIALAGCGTDPLIDPPPMAIPAGRTAADVEQTVTAVASENGWFVVERKPGRLVLRYSPRDFWVNVEVHYDEQQIVIRYLDSSNLKYHMEGDHPNIHPNYNRWVNNLAHDIQNRLAGVVAD